MSSNAVYHIYPCGDHAVTVELGKTVNMATHQRVLAVFDYLKQNPIAGVRDIVPAYHTVTVVYDVSAVAGKNKEATVFEHVCGWIEDSLANINDDQPREGRTVEIPVCYDLSLAPDLLSLAAFHRIDPAEVIGLHTADTYRVYMIGFLPGFAYMGSVHPSIATPRHQQPRIHVPAGSVGIAGEQTGIYPFESPGGWQLIGQTPVQMFGRDGCFVNPGDKVKFYSISLAEFNNWP